MMGHMGERLGGVLGGGVWSVGKRRELEMRGGCASGPAPHFVTVNNVIGIPFTSLGAPYHNSLVYQLER